MGGEGRRRDCSVGEVCAAAQRALLDGGERGGERGGGEGRKKRFLRKTSDMVGGFVMSLGGNRGSVPDRGWIWS